MSSLINSSSNSQTQLRSNKKVLSQSSSREFQTSFSTSTPLPGSTTTSNKAKSNKNAQLSSFTSLTPNSRAKIAAWGLPTSILNKYTENGVISMFPWQVECLNLDGVLAGKNLVYSAPTSAGKTLVAEILMLKSVLERKKKALFIVPYISLAREKMHYLHNLVQEEGLKIGGFMGSHAPAGGFQALDIAICTIEKANSLVNKLLEENQLAQLGIVVVDELHLLSDPHRGYLLELLLTKLQYMSRNSSPKALQIIGMSATLPNLPLLAQWLNSALYRTDFRPIPLTEYIKIGNALYNSQIISVKALRPIVPLQNDSDHLVHLCLETLLMGHSVLVFCPSKAWCEKLAENVSSEFFNIGKPADSPQNDPIGSTRSELRSQLVAAKLMEVLEHLKRCPAGLDPVLARTVRFGVAFHHAGLTMEERDIIEGSFRSGALRVLVATSTLSSGVNLPARRVIIRSAFFQGSPIDVLAYRQMVGRAGRQGVDVEGESILICQEHEQKQVEKLIKAELKPVQSCLAKAGDETLAESMKRAILEVIASGVATKPSDVEIYANCTLLAASWRESDPERRVSESLIVNSIEFLEKNEFVRTQTVDGTEDVRYVPTQLGQACLASALSPDESLVVLGELQKARRNFSLESDLHVIYQVTPTYLANQWTSMDWLAYLTLWENLSPELKRVGELVGVEERFLVRSMKGNVNSAVAKQAKEHAIHVRFYTALALHDLVNEVPLPTVTQKYGCNKGFLQNLQQQTSTFAGMVKAFCNKLGWHSLSLLLEHSQERLQFGVQRELCDLVRLPCLDGQRARLLFNAGFESVASLAAALPMDVEVALRKAMPFESNKALDGETAYEVQKRQASRMVWITGKKGIVESEAARMIVNEAQDLLKKELGLKELQWDKQNQNPEINLISLNRQSIAFNSPILLSNSKRFSNSPKSSPLLLQQSRHSSIKSLRVSSSRSNTRLTSTTVSGCSTPLSTSKSRDSRLNLNKPEDSNNKPKAMDITPDLFDSNSTINAEVTFDSFQLDTQALGEIQMKENLHNKRNSLSISRSLPPPTKKLRQGSPATFSGPKTYPETGSEDLFPEKSPSQPKTPHYDVCSEEIVFVSNLSANSSINPTLTPNCIDSPKERSRHEETLSDSYFEAVFQTYFKEATPPDRTESSKAPSDENNVLENSLDQIFDLKRSTKKTRPPPKKKTTPSRIIKEILPSKPDFLGETTNQSISVIESQDLVTETPVRTRKTHAKTIFKPVMLNSTELVEATPPVRSRTLRGRSKLESGIESTIPLTSLMKQSKRTILAKISEKFTTGKKYLVNVCQNETDFEEFFTNWNRNMTFAVSLVLETKVLPPKVQIGARISRQSVKITPNEDGIRLGNSDQILIGAAVYWNNEVGYYVSFNRSDSNVDLQIVTTKFNEAFKKSKICLMWSAAKQLRAFNQAFGINLECSTKVYDLEIASWLMDPESEDNSLQKLVTAFSPEMILDQQKAKEKGVLWFEEACREGMVLISTFPAVRTKLEELRLWDSFQMEMLSMRCLVGMELNGLGFDKKTAEKLKIMLENKLEKLKTLAHHLAGRPFRLTSLDDVSKVVYNELGLSKHGTIMRKNRKQVRSVSKEALLRLVDAHPLPQVILDWRKVNSALNKVIFPLSKLAEKNVGLNMDRIYGECQFHSATGRVSMREPDLQSIPRDFIIKSLESSKEIISMRKAFIPRKGAVLLTADYSQLELRILAFLADEPKLKTILNSDGDVFKLVAAKWKNISESQVNAELRQQAKQVCYGMIYGIGPKALGEQLGLDESEAVVFMESFKNSYKGIAKFLQETVKKCRDLGYVETLLHRRRYLPAIKSSQIGLRSQAERQAVNTTVQGSAADLVKAALVKIEEQLKINFPNTSPVLQRTNSQGWRRNTEEIHGAHLVLQLHDELMYEVFEENLVQVAQIVKMNMEKALPLDVQLPVAVKSGHSWGTLTALEF